MEIFNPDIYSGNIIMSRVRLARNLKGYPFIIEDEQKAKEVIKDVNRALIKCGTFNLYYVKNLPPIKLEAMKERYLISSELIENERYGAALINDDESISVMVNEEDVIREQCFMKGLRIDEAYKAINRIDDELSKNLNIAFSERFGYLTACTTNVGTGLRASVMMFLPALTVSGKISVMIDEVNKLGLTVRGVYGEGSSAEGYVYQISNEVTLGTSEYGIITAVRETVERICTLEREEMERIFTGKNEIKTMDKVRKAYGVLTNAVLLSYSEFLGLIAEVKLGAMLGMIDITDLSKIDDLIVSVRPSTLCESYGKKLSITDRDLFRAEVVGKTLLKLKEQ